MESVCIKGGDESGLSGIRLCSSFLIMVDRERSMRSLGSEFHSQTTQLKVEVRRALR